jgi:nitrite reductase (NO-forming)
MGNSGLRVRWKDALVLLAAVGMLGVAAVACDSADKERKISTTLPTKVEVATLVQPPYVPAPITRKETALVKVELEVVEKVGRLADGVEYKYWAFGGTVPGPMIRVREGDVVELTLKNSPDSTFPHSIDLHAVTGPGGGAVVTQVAPGQAKTFRFAAINPGLYVYHCATPLIPHHIASGMYGLILVEPAKGLPSVDREFYVMQGEFYTSGGLGEAGLQEFSADKMLAEQPEYVVFNGSVGSLTGEGALRAAVGEKVRIFFGVGGPNITSSFHVIGEIFDAVHQEGATEATHNVQTTYVPSGGATWVEFGVEVPGTYILVDHSLSRLLRGAAGYLVVEGPEAPHIFQSLSGDASSGSH